MDGIIEAFHLDIRLLIAQLINFTIVLLVLHKFVYKPLLKNMNDRTGKIEKGLEDAQTSQEELKKAEEMRDQKIKEAKLEANEILEKMQVLAEKNKDKVAKEAQEEAGKIIEKAKKEIESEKDKMIKEVRQEIGTVTGIALEKVLGEKQSKEIDDKIVKQAIRDIKNQ